MLTKETYFNVWGIWLIPLDLRYASLDGIRNWAKCEGLAREERFVAQGLLKGLERFYPRYMRTGVLVHLYRDRAGGVLYEERLFVSVAALIRRNKECRILRFQLRYPDSNRDAGRVLFDFSSPEMPGVEALSSVSFSKRICEKFLRMFKTLEEQGYDVSRSLDVRPDLKRILLSEEVFDVDVCADLRANFSRDSENKRIHDVEFRLFPNFPAPVESPGSADPSKEVLQKLIEEFLFPYRWAFDLYQGTTDGFLTVLDLLARHGGCPSVVTTMLNRDSETPDVCNFREILEKVTLLGHSVNVARMMLKRMKETFCGSDYVSLIPKAFIISFGHDLGKIPFLRESPIYPDPDHPLVSAQKLEEIFFSKTAPPWFPDALNLIRRHHGPFLKDSSISLRWADLSAREIEIETYGDGLKVTEWKEWFDVKRFLEILGPKVNILQGTNRFNAFSLGSLVYCQPNFLYESAGKLASEKKVIDMRLRVIAEREQALMRIVQSLREAGILSEHIGESFIGRIYKVETDMFSRRMFLIPLRIEVFGLPSRIQSRKEGYLQLIRKVTPAEKIYL